MEECYTSIHPKFRKKRMTSYQQQQLTLIKSERKEFRITEFLIPRCNVIGNNLSSPLIVLRARGLDASIMPI